MRTVQLNVLSKSLHASQVITGFIQLKQEGIINLTINNKEDVQKYPHLHIVEAIIDNQIVLAYDLLDGYNFSIPLAEEYLKTVDYYFKRSCCSHKNKEIIGGEKIRPLGFNYHVSIKNNPVNKDENFKEWFKTLLKSFAKNDFRRFRTEHFEQIPTYKSSDQPKVLFCTRLWCPDGENDEKSVHPDLKVERTNINETRIKIIEELKHQLGPNFIGGVEDTRHAREICPHLILNKRLTKRYAYLKILKSVDICIGTMGLHKSIGWKTGEYIASSKAIVNETLNYEVCGEFLESVNYLSFSSADECVTHVKKLIANPQLIRDMQQANYNYYQNYLKPNVLVYNTIRQYL